MSTTPTPLDPFVLLDRLLAGAILAADETGWADGPEELVRHRLVALMDHPDGLDHVRQVKHEGQLAGLRSLVGEIRRADLSDDPPGQHAAVLRRVSRRLGSADAADLDHVGAWLDDLMPVDGQPGYWRQASVAP